MNNKVCLGLIGIIGIVLSSRPAIASPLAEEELFFSRTIPVAQSPEVTDELENPEWQEVEPAFIDIANIQRNGDFVIFDTVDYEAGYTRLEGNCSTNQVRTLRDGYFLSMTTVSYRDFSEPTVHEFADSSPLQQQLLEVACAVEVES
ncbi:MAG: hypothetical protein AAFY20_04260 [Cyanobacteria bacterium J06639_14]